MNLKNCSNFVTLGLILGGVGVVAAGILAWFNSITQPLIAEADRKKTNQALSQVLPAFTNAPSENMIEIDGVKFYGAFNNDQLVAIAAEGKTNIGYAGEIKGLVGLSPDGVVLTAKGDRSAVLITSQNETPGLGTLICNRQTVKTIGSLFSSEKADNSIMPANSVLDSFANVSTNDTPVLITKDGGKIEFITGATVTSRAVADLVDNVLISFDKNRALILENLNQKASSK